MKEAER